MNKLDLKLNLVFSIHNSLKLLERIVKFHFLRAPRRGAMINILIKYLASRSFKNQKFSKIPKIKGENK